MGGQLTPHAGLRLAALLLTACLTLPTSLSAQSGSAKGALSRAELTGGVETSTQADVERVLEAVSETSQRIFVTHLGYSEEGRRLHMAVWGDVAGPTPDQVRAANAVRVLVFANIHAGEVAGKEAALILLRELSEGAHAEWADSLVLLVVPNYNPDGNERVGLRNRRLQHGPTGGMGQRTNAAGLDLNRDNMKLESAEARSLVRVLNEYDPHVIMDLHTTNGTVHGYHLTYSPPLHPDTPAGIDRLLREDWLPWVTRSIREATGWETYHYGNVPRSREGGGGPERGWYTFGFQPRFTTNYFGLRNRFGILSEAYSYASFPDRIEATRLFVEAVVDYAYVNAGVIRRTVEEADSRPVAGQPLTLAATFDRTDPVTVLLGEVKREKNPYSGDDMLLREDVTHPESMPEFGRFAPTRTAISPAAYLVPDSLAGIGVLLAAHGIKMARTRTPLELEVEAFRVDSVYTAAREYQGHMQTSLAGAYEVVRRGIPAGTLVVPMNQPLARLVFALLEPTATDGVVNWNFLDSELVPGQHVPIVRVETLPIDLD